MSAKPIEEAPFAGPPPVGAGGAVCARATCACPMDKSKMNSMITVGARKSLIVATLAFVRHSSEGRSQTGSLSLCEDSDKPNLLWRDQPVSAKPKLFETTKAQSLNRSQPTREFSPVIALFWSMRGVSGKDDPLIVTRSGLPGGRQN